MVGVIRFERTISRSRTARSGLTELHAVVWMVGLEPTISLLPRQARWPLRHTQMAPTPGLEPGLLRLGNAGAVRRCGR